MRKALERVMGKKESKLECNQQLEQNENHSMKLDSKDDRDRADGIKSSKTTTKQNNREPSIDESESDENLKENVLVVCSGATGRVGISTDQDWRGRRGGLSGSMTNVMDMTTDDNEASSMNTVGNGPFPARLYQINPEQGQVQEWTGEEKPRNSKDIYFNSSTAEVDPRSSSAHEIQIRSYSSEFVGDKQYLKKYSSSELELQDVPKPLKNILERDPSLLDIIQEIQNFGKLNSHEKQLMNQRQQMRKQLKQAASCSFEFDAIQSLLGLAWGFELYLLHVTYLGKQNQIIRSFFKTRKEKREQVLEKVATEIKYMEDGCMPEHMDRLEDMLKDFESLSGNFKDNVPMKKNFMFHISKLSKIVKLKRQNDDVQGQAIMRCAEIHRLVNLLGENQWLIEDLSMAIIQLQVFRLLNIFKAFKSNDKVASKLPYLQQLCNNAKDEESVQNFVKSRLPVKMPKTDEKLIQDLESLNSRRRHMIMGLLDAETVFQTEAEKGNQKIHSLRCDEGDIFQNFLRKISTKNYGHEEEPSKEKFQELMDKLGARFNTMLNNEHIGDTARTLMVLCEMQTHINELQLCRHIQLEKISRLKKQFQDENLRSLQHPQQAEEQVKELERLNSVITRFYEEDSPGLQWSNVATGSRSSPYFSGQTDDVDEAVALIFNYPGAKNKSQFQFQESDWLQRMGGI